MTIPPLPDLLALASAWGRDGSGAGGLDGFALAAAQRHDPAIAFIAVEKPESEALLAALLAVLLDQAGARPH